MLSRGRASELSYVQKALQMADSRDLTKIRRMQKRFVGEHGYLPTMQQIAQELGLPVSRVYDLFAARRRRQGQSMQWLFERFERSAFRIEARDRRERT